jgi:hypothetical protein
MCEWVIVVVHLPRRLPTFGGGACIHTRPQPRRQYSQIWELGTTPVNYFTAQTCPCYTLLILLCYHSISQSHLGGAAPSSLCGHSSSDIQSCRVLLRAVTTALRARELGTTLAACIQDTPRKYTSVHRVSIVRPTLGSGRSPYWNLGNNI